MKPEVEWKRPVRSFVITGDGFQCCLCAHGIEASHAGKDYQRQFEHRFFLQEYFCHPHAESLLHNHASRKLPLPIGSVTKESVDYQLKPKQTDGGNDYFGEEDLKCVQVAASFQTNQCANRSSNNCNYGDGHQYSPVACSQVVSVARIDRSGRVEPTLKPYQKHNCAEDCAGILDQSVILHGAKERQLNGVAQEAPMVIQPQGGMSE